MNGTIQKLWAEVKANRDFIFVQTLSGHVIALPDPKGRSFFLSRVSPIMNWERACCRPWLQAE